MLLISGEEEKQLGRKSMPVFIFVKIGDERIGLLPPINRSDSGIRDYSSIDVRRVEFIKCMRSAGLPIEVLIEYYRLVQQGDETIEARKEILIDQRQQLVAKMAEIQKTIELVDHKLEVYENILLKKEQELLEIRAV